MYLVVLICTSEDSPSTSVNNYTNPMKYITKNPALSLVSENGDYSSVWGKYTVHVFIISVVVIKSLICKNFQFRI